jgi:MoxR-like ATPase
MQRFEGTQNYVATDDLKVAVNAAVLLRRPLLVKGEPGTGKTVLAHEIAKAVGAPLIEWNVKSTTKAQQGLYEYDAVARLRDGQLGDERVHDISNYIRRGKLWEAFTSPQLPVLLIDEIDKADIEFPNDLLQELDRMAFHVYETDETITAKERPIVVITSNNEKELPDAFLRRCFFHYIKFPDRETMQAIIDVHFPDIQKVLVSKAMDIFYEVREVPGLKKKPSTSELLDWLKLLMNEDMPLEVLQNRDPSNPPAPRRSAQERAGRDAVRTAGLHGAAPGVSSDPMADGSFRGRVRSTAIPAEKCDDGLVVESGYHSGAAPVARRNRLGVVAQSQGRSAEPRPIGARCA